MGARSAGLKRAALVRRFSLGRRGGFPGGKAPHHEVSSQRALRFSCRGDFAISMGQSIAEGREQMARPG